MDERIDTSSETPAKNGSGFAPIAFIVASLAFMAILILRGGVLNSAALLPNPRAGTQPSSNSEARLLYNRYCSVCHGAGGGGDGPAAIVLDPRPRDFRLGKYRLISTTNGVPSRQDLVRTIRNGMPGTSMPAWRHFSDHQVQALAEYCSSVTTDSLKQQLGARKLKPAVLDSIIKSKTTAGAGITIPTEPPVTPAELAKGRVLFEANCAKCHNSDGSGKLDPTWKTDEGFPIASRNFTANIFKGGGRGADLYTRISTGLPGTPMASFASLGSDDIWCLVHYVQSFRGAHPKPDSGRHDVLVRIEARRFAWNFRHAGPDKKLDTADDIVTNGLLHIPVGKRVSFEMISADVPHTLWIPALRLKQNVVPGRITTGSIQANELGDYGIGCAAACGVGREVMTGTLIVESPAEFDRFLTNSGAP